MGSRKRGRDEMASSDSAPEQSLLQKLRDTWEFSNLMQYIYIFGKAVKIDEDLTIEVSLIYIKHQVLLWSTRYSYGHVRSPLLMYDSTQDLETECLKPESSQVLSDIGLALLKYVSSHRGLT